MILFNKMLSVVFRFFDLKIIRLNKFDKIISDRENIKIKNNALNIFLIYGDSRILEYIDQSKSQLYQDMFVLLHLNFKKDGFFVEFGATNGIDLSNTYLLEKQFNWRGILAEPSKGWHEYLEKNRNASIEKKCVWSKSNLKLDFSESEDQELSTVSEFLKGDLHRREKKISKKYIVETISLEDLLDTYGAPKLIDYLSIDTEGSEYEILKNFDFEKYQFKIITCEHNFTYKRDLIFELLSKNGYERVFDELTSFDDWYVYKGK